MPGIIRKRATDLSRELVLNCSLSNYRMTGYIYSFVIFLFFIMKYSFKEKVFRAVRRVSKGRTATYKEIAQEAGKPKAWRAIGNILNKNFDPKIPCHRVIRSDGKIGGYNRGADKKTLLLKKEKIR